MGVAAFFRGILGSEGIVNAAKDGIDKAILTDEEKHDLWIKYLEATLPMKRARRMVAVIIAFIWAMYTVTGTVLIVLEHSQVEQMIEFGWKVVMPSFTAIVGFYFWRAIEVAKKE